jgi:Fur family zinc uptake transcriptional regulator
MRVRDDLPRNPALVLAELQATPGVALTAYELLARLAATGLRGPQTVYRALDSLQRRGLVHRIESLNAFTVCAHAHGTREHDGEPPHRPAFAVCRSCRSVRELDDPALAAVIGVVAAGTGFAIADRVVEFVGTCPGCMGGGATATV